MVTQRPSRSSPAFQAGALGTRLAVLVVAVTVVLAVATLVVPGAVRLVILQPARDMLFFHRELQPWKDFRDIERLRPSPDDTVVLHAPEDADGDLDIHLDEWHPERWPAPAVLLLHGSSPRGRALGFNMLLAQRLQQAGWLVLTPDARGFGDTGLPRNPRDTAEWSVKRDVHRLVAYARNHPKGSRQVVAVGHSLGGGHLLQSESDELELSAVALLGPTREPYIREPSWWERVRFSSDRGIATLLPREVAAEELRRRDILQLAASRPSRVSGTPILLMDGELEGERLIGMLREAAELKGSDAFHVTVPGSHHYCSAYQLPWPLRTVYVRPAVFERCVRPLLEFMDGAVTRPAPDDSQEPT